MDKEQFDVLVDTVLETTARPPEKLSPVAMRIGIAELDWLIFWPCRS